MSGEDYQESVVNKSAKTLLLEYMVCFHVDKRRVKENKNMSGEDYQESVVNKGAKTLLLEYMVCFHVDKRRAKKTTHDWRENI